MPHNWYCELLNENIPYYVMLVEPRDVNLTDGHFLDFGVRFDPCVDV